MGFAHNDVHPRNCLLDKNLNMKLSDFDCATTVGQFLESPYALWARLIPAGPLKDTYGLCGARTEQFAAGSLLYFMVYGHEPYDELDLKNRDPDELDRWDRDMELPELNPGFERVFDGLIASYWYNVYPTMALLAYDFRRKTKDVASDAGHNPSTVDAAEERKACEALIRRGLLGPELARCFQPAWQRYLRVVAEKRIPFLQVLAKLPRIVDLVLMRQ